MCPDDTTAGQQSEPDIVSAGTGAGRAVLTSDDDEACLRADDAAEADAIIAQSRKGSCKRRGGPRELTSEMLEFARRLAAAEPPFNAARREPCRYRRRAVRHLLASPVFQAAYEQLRSHRSPTLAELQHAARPRDRWTDPAFRPGVLTAPGLTIRLPSSTRKDI